MELVSIIGTLAAVITAGSNAPQAWKTWKRQQTDDLSLNMLGFLFTGLSLWTVYGIIRDDWFIIGANAASAMLIGYVLSVKLRNLWYAKSASRKRR